MRKFRPTYWMSRDGQGNMARHCRCSKCEEVRHLNWNDYELRPPSWVPFSKSLLAPIRGRFRGSNAYVYDGYTAKIKRM